VIIDSLAVPPNIVCIGFACLPKRFSNTFLSASLIAPAEINAEPLLVTTSSNVVLFTKNSGTENIASDGLSILIPFGSLAVFKTLVTACSACRSVSSSPASLALDLNTSFASFIASCVGLYLAHGKILLF